MSQYFFEAEYLNRQLCAALIKPYPTRTKDGDNITYSAGVCMMFNPVSGEMKRLTVPEKTLAMTNTPGEIHVNYNYVKIAADGLSASYETSLDNPFVLNLIDAAPVETIQTDDTGYQYQNFFGVCENALSNALLTLQTKPDAQFFYNDKDAIISVNASDQIQVTTLFGRRGFRFFTLPAFDSSTDSLYLYSSSVIPATVSSWTKTARTTLNRTQYNSAAGFAAVTVNQWTVNYLWRGLWDETPNDDSNPTELFITLGYDSYLTSADALAEEFDSNRYHLPFELADNAVCIGKIAVKNEGVGGASIIKGRDFYKMFF